MQVKLTWLGLMSCSKLKLGGLKKGGDKRQRHELEPEESEEGETKGIENCGQKGTEFATVSKKSVFGCLYFPVNPHANS